VSKIIDGETTNVWTCVDLRTGEEIWYRTGVSEPDYLNWVERTVQAVPGEEARKLGLTVEFLDISGGMLRAYDPSDGDLNYEFSISPLTSTVYYATNPPLFLSMQNMGGGNYRLINWTIGGDMAYPNLINRRVEVLNNITFPYSSVARYDFNAMIGVRTEGIMPSSTGVNYGTRIIAVDLLTGQELWQTETDTDSGLGDDFSGSTRIADQGKFAILLNDGYFHCWDLRTGQYLWKGELSSWPWGIWGQYDIASAYGMLYYPQYDGVVARDWDTGKIVWRYRYTAPYPYETVYSDNDFPFRTDLLIADGVVYCANDEHSASNPLPRGYKIHAMDALTGEGLWNVTGQFGADSIAEGYMLAGNRDGYVYCFGKGKSETTVTAPDVAVPKGTAITIKGSVLDLSPAQPGTPCVDANSMGVQMDYLHMQQPVSGYWGNQTITGVPVLLTAIGEDGNYVDIGTTTTDGYYGTFGHEWTPPDEGKYKIIASFEGDDSYGSSGASTYVTVGPAPEDVDVGPVEDSVSDVKDSVNSQTTYIIVILVIAIIGLVIALYVALKPRK
jgi:hypothetical protein